MITELPIFLTNDQMRLRLSSSLPLFKLVTLDFMMDVKILILKQAVEEYNSISFELRTIKNKKHRFNLHS